MTNLTLIAAAHQHKRIRRFMPGDTELSAVSQPQLVALAHHLNSLSGHIDY
ncbi:hypothetical protein U8C35_29195 (plasmid) [Sinorhizobium medicae]|uniref:hypothetical protein n=1 Tax=Sinorhizobium medicae TaxID=110321 RepID=UPI002AF6B07E|nr:hypothetical protein [Sinorhizobium medicae]WQO62355.1 hypothetical protein U8C35_29195 [Sinorhizobium medicae]